MAGTGVRNTHNVGDYLMIDDESGFSEYRSNMRQIWDGTWRRKDQFETRQPQEFVRALNDPKALRHIRPESLVAVPVNSPSAFVGETGVPSETSPADHIFATIGIGEMIIESADSTNVFQVS